MSDTNEKTMESPNTLTMVDSTACDKNANSTGNEEHHGEEGIQALGLSACATTGNQKHCRFLELPPEIRLSIYEALFASTRRSEPLGPPRRSPWQTVPPLQHAVTRTSRQLRKESLPVFYSTVPLLFVSIINCDFGYFIDCMDQIGPTNTSHMRMLEFEVQDVLKCAAGLLDLVRWATKTACGSDLTNLIIRVDASNDGFAPSDLVKRTEDTYWGALELTFRIRKQGRITEIRLRDAFHAWMEEEDYSCSCGFSEEQDESSCSMQCKAQSMNVRALRLNEMMFSRVDRGEEEEED